MIALLLWLIDATIKGSLLIVLAAAIYFAAGKRFDPRWRHLLWVVVLLRLVLPAMPSSRWSVYNLLPSHEPLMMSARGIAIVPAPMAAGEEVIELHEPRILTASRWIVAIWLAGVALLALRTLAAAIRTQRFVNRLAKDGSFVDGIRVVESEHVATPALHGLLRPVLLLPSGLTYEERRHIVLHELWHLRRLDVAVSWLLAAVQTIHWFNPLVWFAASRIKEERELSCDELALSLLEEEERIGYGRTILKLLERFRTAAAVPALVGIVNHKQKMKRRLTMIASYRNRTRFTVLFLMLVAATSVVALTDANSGDRTRFFNRTIDPVSLATMERLQQRISLDLTNASLADLLNAVSNKIGTPVTQSPKIASLPVQSARFTLKADNVPAHAVLMEALMPFELSAEPAEGSVVVVDEPQGTVLLPAPDGPGTVNFFVRRTKGHDEMIVSNGTPEEAERVIEVLEEGKSPEGVNERVFVRRLGSAHTFDADGKMRRELTLKMDENGSQSTGKLTIEITK